MYYMYNNINCCIFICLLVGSEHDVFDECVVDDKTGAMKEVVGSNANEVVGAEDVIGGSAK